MGSRASQAERRYATKATPAPKTIGLADALFTRTQQGVLGHVFGQPDRSFYVSELISSLRLGSGAVQRELARLEQGGLVTMRAVGNQKHYQANAASPLFSELTSIARKTGGLPPTRR